mgnify:CR=1 FL=1
MDYNRILHGISNKDLVNFVKYDLGVMLEDENEAGGTGRISGLFGI